MTGLIVHSAGPACSLQDLGRPGYMARGLSPGGAADLLALHEGAALLGQNPALAALEMGGMGGVFEAGQDLRIALSGAPMRARIDGRPAPWAASHRLARGQRLEIGGAEAGVYGYLHVGGGFDTPEILGSRACHGIAGLGTPVQAGDALPVGEDRKPDAPAQRLDVADRFSGGTVRIVAGPQTGLFAPEELARFQQTGFHRGVRANRMGVEILSDGGGFAAEGQLAIVSEVITPGDIQMTGDGQPYVLMPECQTTGGYPRLASVLPCDLPRVAQAPGGAPLRFRLVTLDEAIVAEAAHAAHLERLRRAPVPLVRDPRDIPDLLAYQLIGGAISALDTGEDT